MTKYKMLANEVCKTYSSWGRLSMPLSIAFSCELHSTKSSMMAADAQENYCLGQASSLLQIKASHQEKERELQRKEQALRRRKKTNFIETCQSSPRGLQQKASIFSSFSPIHAAPGGVIWFAVVRAFLLRYRSSLSKDGRPVNRKDVTNDIYLWHCVCAPIRTLLDIIVGQVCQRLLIESLRPSKDLASGHHKLSAAGELQSSRHFPKIQPKEFIPCTSICLLHIPLVSLAGLISNAIDDLQEVTSETWGKRVMAETFV